MSVTKAFLIIFLLLAIEFVLHFLFTLIIIWTDANMDYIGHYQGMADIVILIIASVVVLFPILKMKLKWDFVLSKVKTLNSEKILFVLLVAVGLTLIARPFHDYKVILDIFKHNKIEPYSFSITSYSYYHAFAGLFIAPFFEELIFRKYIFSKLLNTKSLKTAIIVSSICFALVHLPNYENFIPTFISGIVYCLIYYKSKNIIYPIVLHIICNLTLVITDWYGGAYFDWIYGFESYYIYGILLIIGSSVVLLGIKKISAANMLQ